MKQDTMLKTIDKIFKKVKEIHLQGSKEYARGEGTDIFANFKRAGMFADISKEKAALVYLVKHIDGISAHINGHKSQREPVFTRYIDAICYLCLLWAMEESSEIKLPSKNTEQRKELNLNQMEI